MEADKLQLKVRMAVLLFLEFAVWGAYLTSLGAYLANIGQGEHIGWFYAVQGVVSIFMPGLIGIVADRWVQAQKMLSICHVLAGGFMCAASAYALTTPEVEFGPLFTLYTLSVAFFMPTIGLTNSVCYAALSRYGLDPVKHFPPVRVFGTIGFIIAMLFVNFTGYQNTASQLLTSGLISFGMAAYALTMPACPTAPKGQTKSLSEALGLKAFALFKNKQMAVFFIFSMLLGVSLQITNGFANPFIQSFGSIPEYADTWGVHNANALISISQMSETLCILLIPFFLRRYGIKVVMLMAMAAWAFRFGFFGLGNPGSGVWLFIASMIVYGIAFDFFNVSGSLYVDKKTTADTRSSAQGLFMIMTNGIGASLGTFIAGTFVVNKKVFAPGLDADQMLAGWRESWFIFAAYALVVGVLFFFIFHPKKQAPDNNAVKAAEDTDSGAAGMTETDRTI